MRDVPTRISGTSYAHKQDKHTHNASHELNMTRERALVRTEMPIGLVLGRSQWRGHRLLAMLTNEVVSVADWTWCLPRSVKAGTG